MFTASEDAATPFKRSRVLGQSKILPLLLEPKEEEFQEDTLETMKGGYTVRALGGQGDTLLPTLREPTHHTVSEKSSDRTKKT